MGIEQNKLKLYRKANGWTQKYMADRLGVTQQRYQQWETAEEDMRTSTLRKICIEFQLNPSWLLGLSDEMELKTNNDNEGYKLTIISKNFAAIDNGNNDK